MLDSIATEHPTPLCIRRSKLHERHAHRRTEALSRLAVYVQEVLHKLRILHQQKSSLFLISTGRYPACSPWGAQHQGRCGLETGLRDAVEKRCFFLSDFDCRWEYVVVQGSQR